MIFIATNEPTEMCKNFIDINFYNLLSPNKILDKKNINNQSLNSIK